MLILTNIVTIGYTIAIAHAVVLVYA